MNVLCEMKKNPKNSLDVHATDVFNYWLACSCPCNWDNILAGKCMLIAQERVYKSKIRLKTRKAKNRGL